MAQQHANVDMEHLPFVDDLRRERVMGFDNSSRLLLGRTHILMVEMPILVGGIPSKRI